MVSQQSCVYTFISDAIAERRQPARKGPHHEWDNQEDRRTNPAYGGVCCSLGNMIQTAPMSNKPRYKWYESERIWVLMDEAGCVDEHGLIMCPLILLPPGFSPQ